MRSLTSVMFYVIMLLTSVCTGAEPFLAVDFNSDKPTEEYTQSGFSQIIVPDAGSSMAASLVIGAYTVRFAGGTSINCLAGGASLSYNGRDRTNNIGNAGAFTQSALIRDRVAVWEGIPINPSTGFGTGPGLYLMVEGLQPNKAYVIQAWGADYDKKLVFLKNGYSYGFDATFETAGYASLPELGNYTVSGNPTTITDNNQFSITGTITSDSSGRIIYKSISTIDANGDPTKAGPGLLNGFTLTATAPPPTAFDLWRSQWGVDIGSGTDDYDGDMLNNFYEYALNGDPTNALNKGVAPVIVKTGESLEYIHVVRADDASLVYTVEVSTNLTSGTWVSAGYTATTNVTGGAYNEIKYTLPSVEKNFIRLKIEGL